MARHQTSSGGRTCLIAFVGFSLLASILACAILFLIQRGVPLPAEETRRGTLHIAYSPEKRVLFEDLITRFNASDPRLPHGQRVSLSAESLLPEAMLEAAGSGEFQALSPDSSIWLSEIDRRWAGEHGADTTLTGIRTRYMVSPVVIAMWDEVARDLGYPEQDLGWADVLRAADADPSFRWSHASTQTASGVLTTLAQFYAGAGITRGLTEEAATAEETLAYVSRLSRTVKHYGEGELAVMEQIEANGRNFLDAFVVQEQLVVQYNQAHPDQPRLVAIYPAEGTLWEDHPLALLELPDLTEDQRLAYQLFTEFLLSPETQQLVLKHGYRPADLSLELDDPASPINATNGADPSQPQTTLQMPSPAVIDVVRNAWLYTKRRTNIFLVADVSGSMDGEKMEQARVALQSFVDQIQPETERVGLIAFSTDAFEVMPLTQIGEGRERLQEEIQGLEPAGNTALIDAVALGYRKLMDLNDTERINALVVMTDGQENSSRNSLPDLVRSLEAAAESELPVLVFCIAYGEDADTLTLERVSAAGRGFTRTGDPDTIRDLYRTLSTYF